MRCLICAENGAAELIKEDLMKTGLYKNWEFVTCGDAREMLGYARERPDVLVVSRFLPGMDPVELLDRMPTMFPASHIVLLAGRVDEKGRGYIKAAAKRGLVNVVTGKLPGNRPYTLLEALTANREGESILEDEADGEENDEKIARNGGFDNSGALGNSDHDKEPGETTKAGEPFKVPSRQENKITGACANAGISEKPSQRDDFDFILSSVYETPVSGRLSFGREGSREAGIGMRVSPPKPSPGRGTGFQGRPARDVSGRAKNVDNFARKGRSILVLTAANKGGVGKTTVAITLAVALARAGIPVALWDLDLGAPDVATFFGIKNVLGIEALPGREIRHQVVESLLVNVEENLYVLPGPMDKTLPAFESGEIAGIAQVLLSMFSVVIGDTPPEFWTKGWLEEIFPMADKVLAVVDQSKFSEAETAAYAPCLISMGVSPEKISIILNRFSHKLHNARTVEKYFCSGFKKEVPARILPKVVATIPENWETYAQKGYKGEVAGLEDAYSQWHNLAGEIASMAGYSYSKPEVDKRGMFKFFKKR